MIETMYFECFEIHALCKETNTGSVPSLKEKVQMKQQNFISSKLVDPEEPLRIVYKVCQENNTSAYKNFQKVPRELLDMCCGWSAG